MNIKRIQISLIEADPHGIKVIEIGRLKLKGFSIPKSLISDAKKFDDLNDPCLYLLCQRDGQEVYIGEAENFFDRVVDHSRKKDFWELAIVFVGGLNKAEAKYLEALAVTIAKQAKRYKIKNTNLPRAPKLSSFDEAELKNCFDDIKLLISLLGYPIFEKITFENTREENIWYCTLKKNQATAIDDGSTFTILKGSIIDPHERGSIKESFALKRRELLSQNAMFKNESYVLKENISFPSANQAGQFCLGGHMNAWTTWKNKDGKTMDEVLRKNLDRG